MVQIHFTVKTTNLVSPKVTVLFLVIIILNRIKPQTYNLVIHMSFYIRHVMFSLTHLIALVKNKVR